MAKRSSRLPGFYKLSQQARLKQVERFANLESEASSALRPGNGLSLDQADHMIENAIGVFALPLGVATNFLINGREVLVPMVVEEPSVVAGASYMAKLARSGGGFKSESTAPEMIAQIQVLDVPDQEKARQALLQHQDELLAEADSLNPLIKQLGGGARCLEVRSLEKTAAGPMLVVHLVYDTRDAMGANTVNTAAEALAPRIEGLTGGRVLLRILSNLADRRLARASCRIPCQELASGTFPGEWVRDRIIEAWAFADSDPYRAATHNKGIMNGIDAVVIATGNDWRAVEAGAHAYAARSGHYRSLNRWWSNEEGDLEGELELPMAVGTVGGATGSHPTARACLAILGVKSARELAEIITCVGLAQNLAALRALATEGIQRGHMSLHARQVAIAAGARGEMAERLARQLVRENNVLPQRAEELLRQWRQEPG